MSLVGTLSRLRAVGVVAAGTAAGVVVPELGGVVSRFTVPLVALLVFTSLHGVEVHGRSARRTGAFVATVLLTSYLLVPSLLAGVAFSLPPSAATALLVVVAAPTTAGSALVWTDMSRGDGFFATAGAVASLLVAPAAVPVVLSALGTRGAAVPVVPIGRTLLLVVGGGAVAARVVPEDAVSERTSQRLALLAIFLLLYASISVADTTGVSVVTLGVAAGCALATMVAGGTVGVLGVVTDRLKRSEATALLYASSLKNLGVSLAVAAALGVGAGVVVIVAFYTVQQLASGLLATKLGQSDVGRAAAGVTEQSSG